MRAARSALRAGPALGAPPARARWLPAALRPARRLRARRHAARQRVRAASSARERSRSSRRASLDQPDHERRDADAARARCSERFPDEIEHVFARTGTAEVATDPMGPNVSDTYVMLKPREGWKKAQHAGGARRGDGGGASTSCPGRTTSSASPSSCASTSSSPACAATSRSRSSATISTCMLRAGDRDRRRARQDPGRGRREGRAGHGPAGADHRHRPARDRPLRPHVADVQAVVEAAVGGSRRARSSRATSASTSCAPAGRDPPRPPRARDLPIPLPRRSRSRGLATRSRA